MAATSRPASPGPADGGGTVLIEDSVVTHPCPVRCAYPHNIAAQYEYGGMGCVRVRDVSRGAPGAWNTPNARTFRTEIAMPELPSAAYAVMRCHRGVFTLPLCGTGSSNAAG